MRKRGQKTLLRERVDAARLTIETYVERIARDDRRAYQELEALALEGLNSGESIEAAEAFLVKKGGVA